MFLGLGGFGHLILKLLGKGFKRRLLLEGFEVEVQSGLGGSNQDQALRVWDRGV